MNTTADQAVRVPNVRRRRAARFLGGVAGLAVAFTGVMGFAHTKPGRPLLALMGMATHAKGGCPFGYDKPVSPAQHEATLHAFAASHPSEALATKRPALGFELGRDTRVDVERWATTYGISCKVGPGGPDLDCSDVPAAALPASQRGAAVSSAWFNFGANDALVSVTVVRRAPDAEPMSALFGRVTADVGAEAGPMTKLQGEPTAAYLSKGDLYQVSAEYTFRNYYAVVRATNLGGQGFALTEDYRRLAD